MFFGSSVVGIDIGSTAIKIVEVSSGKKNKLESVGLSVIPPGAIVDGRIVDPDSLTQSLKQALKNAKLSPRNKKAAIALSGADIIVKRAKFPQPDANQPLSEMVHYEAEQHFQHDIEDLYYDHFELPGFEEEAEASVLLVGAKKESVEQYISIIKGCGLGVGFIESDVTATINALEYSNGMSSGITAIVNIGTNASQVTLLGNGQYLYTRNLSIGGSTYTNLLAENLGLSRENAESLKLAACEGNTQAASQIKPVADEVNEQLVNEINMSADYFFQSGESPSIFSQINTAVFCGGGSHMIGLESYAANNLEIPISIINPFKNIMSGKGLKNPLSKKYSFLFTVAFGLAIRDINEINA